MADIKCEVASSSSRRRGCWARARAMMVRWSPPPLIAWINRPGKEGLFPSVPSPGHRPQGPLLFPGKAADVRVSPHQHHIPDGKVKAGVCFLLDDRDRLSKIAAGKVHKRQAVETDDPFREWDHPG